MSLPDTAQVLIVGGGPAGLCLALALNKHGCPDVVVVDSAAHGENTSRAAVVHAATIETLESIGCGDLLVKEGKRVDRTIVWMDAYPIETAYFSPLSRYTKYPFALAIPQHVTERVVGTVAQERGIHVFRPHAVLDAKPNQEDSTCTDVIFDNGHILRTRCLVGADGARSTIRRLANVGWADPTNPFNANDDDAAHMIIADITLTQSPPIHTDAINLVVTPENALLFVSLPNDPYPEAGLTPGEPVYRIACAIPPQLGAPPHAPDIEYIQKLLDAWGPNIVIPGTPRVQITHTLWSSRFRTRSSIAEHFLTHLPTGDSSVKPAGGQVFLIGDAAHIHPPMGGQGMNLGIRDGIRLAPILTEYIRALSPPLGSGDKFPTAEATSKSLEVPLQAWASERRARALTIIRMVKDLQRIMWIPNGTRWILGVIPLNVAWLRKTFLRFLTTFEWWRASAAYRVSGLGNP